MRDLYVTYAYQSARGSGIGRSIITSQDLVPDVELTFSQIKQIEKRCLELAQVGDSTATGAFLTNWRWLAPD